jgi:hypothetical protein
VDDRNQEQSVGLSDLELHYFRIAKLNPKIDLEIKLNMKNLFVHGIICPIGDYISFKTFIHFRRLNFRTKKV